MDTMSFCKMACAGFSFEAENVVGFMKWGIDVLPMRELDFLDLLLLLLRPELVKLGLPLYWDLLLLL